MTAVFPGQIMSLKKPNEHECQDHRVEKYCCQIATKIEAASATVTESSLIPSIYQTIVKLDFFSVFKKIQTERRSVGVN